MFQCIDTEGWSQILIKITRLQQHWHQPGQLILGQARENLRDQFGWSRNIDPFETNYGCVDRNRFFIYKQLIKLSNAIIKWIQNKESEKRAYFLGPGEGAYSRMQFFVYR